MLFEVKKCMAPGAAPRLTTYNYTAEPFGNWSFDGNVEFTNLGAVTGQGDRLVAFQASNETVFPCILHYWFCFAQLQICRFGRIARLHRRCLVSIIGI